MSDIDRVFARLGGRSSGPGEQRELRSIPRKGAAAGSRTVEVVRLPARRAGSEPDAQRKDFQVRAQTWDQGFPAQSSRAPAPPPTEAQAAPAAPSAEPVVHVMPMWERTGSDPSPEPPAEPPAPTRARAAHPGRRPRSQPAQAARGIADPFDAADDRANCLRCGYVVEAERERRGLMTCAACR
jgi:hypothetical protein